VKKQLILTKTTIANLDRSTMSCVKGGCTTETIGYTCDKACTTGPIYYIISEEKLSANTCYTEPGIVN
jgi:hypothetical protein